MGDGFIIASLPALALVRRRTRAWRCRKAPGRRPDRWCAVIFIIISTLSLQRAVWLPDDLRDRKV